MSQLANVGGRILSQPTPSQINMCTVRSGLVDLNQTLKEDQPPPSCPRFVSAVRTVHISEQAHNRDTNGGHKGGIARHTKGTTNEETKEMKKKTHADLVEGAFLSRKGRGLTNTSLIVPTGRATFCAPRPVYLNSRSSSQSKWLLFGCDQNAGVRLWNGDWTRPNARYTH